MQKLNKGSRSICRTSITMTLPRRMKGHCCITGTGKGKKGTDVVFAVGVFEAAPGQLAGVAFVVDKNVEDRYKEAVRYICKTIRVEKDFTEEKHEVAKPILNK